MSREAVIVSTARTPIGKAFRGAFNKTHGATLAGHAIAHAVARARGIEPDEVEDVLHRLRPARGRDRPQRRAPCRGARRPAGHDRGRHHGQPLLQRRACRPSPWPPSASSSRPGAGRMVAGGARVHQPGAEQPEQVLHYTEDWLMRQQAGALAVHDRDRRHRWPRATASAATCPGRLCPGPPSMRTAAAQEAGQASTTRSCRSPSVKHRHRQGDRRNLVTSRGQAGQGRGQPPLETNCRGAGRPGSRSWARTSS